jgi:hypothetical protein
MNKIYCEFTILALLDLWEELGSISAYEIASKNNIPMPIFWQHYKDWKAIKRI